MHCLRLAACNHLMGSSGTGPHTCGLPDFLPSQELQKNLQKDRTCITLKVQGTTEMHIVHRA